MFGTPRRTTTNPSDLPLESFVGETAFISNCNLVLEGTADQVLLAGMTSRLRRLGVPEIQNLDLNAITLVPAGSAGHVPYMVFLARGRDEEKPAVVVLLDSDDQGNNAVKSLKKGGPRSKQLIEGRYVCSWRTCRRRL